MLDSHRRICRPSTPAHVQPVTFAQFRVARQEFWFKKLWNLAVSRVNTRKLPASVWLHCDICVSWSLFRNTYRQGEKHEIAWALLSEMRSRGLAVNSIRDDSEIHASDESREWKLAIGVIENMRQGNRVPAVCMPVP